MANSLNISLITAVPDYPTTNRAGTVNYGITMQPLTIYSAASPPPPEGNSGTASSACCTFKLPQNQGPKVNLSIFGTCAELATTLKDCGFVLTALWNGVPVFTSGTQNSPGTNVLSVSNIMGWIQLPQFPCRLGGTWTWQVSAPGSNTPLATSANMLLELCFVWGDYPQGPNNPPNPTVIARPDFGLSYPVDLFRLFLPSPTDLPDQTTDVLVWYLQRAMQIIWNLGLNVNPDTAGTRVLQYEAISGAPAYIETNLGGPFQLSRFINTMFGTVNCYDLAGITQLAMAIIQSSNQTEVFDSRWIFCNGFGYINPGPLIGWPQFPNCNSPFFSKGLPYYNEPPVNPNRQGFGNHAWVEVSADPSDPNNRTVLDATHCLQASPNTPASGSQTRDDYETAQIDQSRGVPVHTYGFNPSSRPQMIGVTTIGKLPVTETPAYPKAATLVNNAACDPQTVRGLVSATIPSAQIESTDSIVSSRGCQVLTNLSGLSPHFQSLHVEISNYEHPAEAQAHYDRLASSLRTTVPSNLFQEPHALGDAATCTVSHVMWRRNSVLTRIFVTLMPGSDLKHIPTLLLDIATSVDSHLRDGAVSSGREMRPHSSVSEGPSVSTPVGKRFSVHLNDVSETQRVRVSEVDDRSVVLPAGPGQDDGAFEFYALKEGQTQVRLCVAHSKTLTGCVAGVTINVHS